MTAGLGETLRLHVMAARARAYVRVVAAVRELHWLAFEVGLPILAVAAYVYLYRSLGAPPEYAGHVLLGGAVTAYWLNVLWMMATQFFWEKQSGHLELFFLAPVSPISVLVGMAAGGIVMSTPRVLSTLLVGSWLFDVPYRVREPWAALAAFVLTLVALYGLGMMLCSLFLFFGREGWHVATLLQEPVYLLSGFYFPVRVLPYGAALAASAIPLTLGLDAMRQLLLGDAGLWPYPRELLGLAALAVAYLAGAHVALHRLEDAARTEGRLTLRWQ